MRLRIGLAVTILMVGSLWSTSASAKFLSVDPVKFDPNNPNPAMFNRYAYAANDPINLIDPDGRMPFPTSTFVYPANIAAGKTHEQASAAHRSAINYEAAGVAIGSATVIAAGACALGGCAAAAPYVSTAFTASNTTAVGMAGTSAVIAGTSTALSGGDASQVATSATGAAVTTGLAVRSGSVFQAGVVFFGGGVTTAAVTDLMDGEKDLTDSAYLATGAINAATGVAPVVPPTVSTAAGALVDSQVQKVFEKEKIED